MGFGPQAIETKACMRDSGLGTEAISASKLGLGAEVVSPQASGRISVFRFVLSLSAFSQCFSLLDLLLLIIMICFSIYMSLFFSLCTIESSINHYLSHPDLIVSCNTD